MAAVPPPAIVPSQVTQPVLWEQTLRNLLDAGVERFYEIGSHKGLAEAADFFKSRGE